MSGSKLQLNKRCANCEHYAHEPQALEALIPGLNILSSAFGSVRDETGLCDLHARFVVPSVSCDQFTQRGLQPGGISG